MRLGIVGAGQLARMMLESASALGLDVVVLAESDQDAAALTCPAVRLGSPKDPAALRSLADEVDVITFDHELVDLEALAGLEAEGATVRPSPAALLYAVDKLEMRRLCQEEQLPGARSIGLAVGSDADVVDLGEQLGWPLVIKSARGGYDGRGVFVVEDALAAAAVIEDIRSTGSGVLVEEAVDIDRELAVLLARRPGGEVAIWPVVETAQLEGVCREVLLPGSIDSELAEEAAALAVRIAVAIDLVGVIAVELFESSGGLLVNELALRPHNSGHWTQDGSVCSQFENHLRAVLDLPLGSTEMTAAAVAMVNVFGGPEGSPALLDGLPGALAVPGAHLHLYGKSSRPGRKLGHVTVTGDNAVEVRRRAWQAAEALGTPVPAEIGARIR
jgi:5-(carboxyamino)imidazole ribonucleotide synthase